MIETMPVQFDNIMRGAVRAYIRLADDSEPAIQLVDLSGVEVRTPLLSSLLTK